MSLDTWLTFVVTAAVILVIPGPTIIYVVGQALNHGRKASLPLAIGVILSDAVCIALSLIGLSALLSLSSTAFLVIKYVGAAYLVYLGLKMALSCAPSRTRPFAVSAYHPTAVCREVFLVNALNPKGIIFYSAFMPQFVNTESGMVFQFGLLTVTFLFLALMNVVGYSLLAFRTGALFKSGRFSRAFHLTGA